MTVKDIKKRPREKVLELFPEIGSRVTPTEISNHIQDRYFSKYICQLRKRGFDFEVHRDGISVVAYTLQAQPENSAEIRGGTKKERKAKKNKVVTNVATRKKPTLVKTTSEVQKKSVVHQKKSGPITHRKPATKLLKEATNALRAIENVEPIDVDDMVDINTHLRG